MIVLMSGYVYTSLKQIALEQSRVYGVQWSCNENAPCGHPELDGHRSVDRLGTRDSPVRCFFEGDKKHRHRSAGLEKTCRNLAVIVRFLCGLKLPKSDVYLAWMLVRPCPPVRRSTNISFLVV